MHAPSKIRRRLRFVPDSDEEGGASDAEASPIKTQRPSDEALDLTTVIRKQVTPPVTPPPADDSGNESEDLFIEYDGTQEDSCMAQRWYEPESPPPPPKEEKKKPARKAALDDDIKDKLTKYRLQVAKLQVEKALSEAAAAEAVDEAVKRAKIKQEKREREREAAAKKEAEKEEGEEEDPKPMGRTARLKQSIALLKKEMERKKLRALKKRFDEPMTVVATAPQRAPRIEDEDLEEAKRPSAVGKTPLKAVAAAPREGGARPSSAAPIAPAAVAATSAVAAAATNKRKRPFQSGGPGEAAEEEEEEGRGESLVVKIGRTIERIEMTVRLNEDFTVGLRMTPYNRDKGLEKGSYYSLYLSKQTEGMEKPLVMSLPSRLTADLAVAARKLEQQMRRRATSVDELMAKGTNAAGEYDLGKLEGDPFPSTIYEVGGFLKLCFQKKEVKTSSRSGVYWVFSVIKDTTTGKDFAIQLTPLLIGRFATALEACARVV